ncbi:hypothetical protein L207DRAFT_639707 [Hyaloscypha variabilis F]|uniref:Uncharacterized protein n=1 Tax=Hyaloscypha variabilis (strain UAMH 11265 / GT02V1 / F) TaxID=1149755 RepID=A0A2J6R367_HYAVF|nr:hypothetical protein L207DRAFT_639707 [Hyaloscypha variabilis F]
MSSSLEKLLAKDPRRETTRALRGLYDGTFDPPAAAFLYFNCVYTAPSLEKATRWLIEMMDAIRFLPDVEKGQGAVLKWSEYPQLDSYNLILWRDRNASYSDNKNYIKETAFIAKLSARRIPRAEFLDEADFSEFENGTIDKAVKGDKKALHELQIEEPWKWAGKQPVAKNEFTRARWNAWKKGAKEIADLSRVNKETREIAQEMLTKMESIEQAPETSNRNDV